MNKHFYSAPIVEIRDETEDAYTLFLKSPEPERFRYQAGQYLTVKMEIDGEEVRRAFSLSSAPGVDQHLSISIKRIPGGKASNYLRDFLQVGDALEIMPPMGNFKADLSPDQSHHYILIGAGSGITPLMSILKAALFHEPLSKVTLWYGNRNEGSIIFREELTALQKQYPDRLHIYHTLTQPGPNWKGFRGRLDEQRIYGLVSELFMVDEYFKQYYICGPNDMMESAAKALDKHAVFPSVVFREYYTASVPSEAEVEQAYSENGASTGGTNGHAHKHHHVQISLDGKKHEVEVEEKETILDAAIDAGIDPPYACQAGICTTCRARVISGEVKMDFDEGLSDVEKEEGYILTCQAHPVSDGVRVEFE